MRKQRIRLSEATLHKIIRKCVNEAVRQMPTNKLRRRTFRKRVNESSMQQNIVVDGEEISFNELQRIAKWYEGLQYESFIVYGDEDEEIPVDVSVDIDLDEPYESEILFNGTSPESNLINPYSETSLVVIVKIYQDYGDYGKTDVNEAISEYLRDEML